MNIIEQLKNNLNPFGMMSKEMQEAMDAIEFRFLEEWVGRTWSGLPESDSGLSLRATYRLRPDYKEEPEIEKCEVYEKAGADRYKVLCYDRVSSGGWRLETACKHIDFIGFLYKGRVLHTSPRMYKQGAQWFPNIDEHQIDQYEVLTPTHVLFRKGK